MLETILGGLKAGGLDPERLSTDDLAPVDEFHTGGRGATIEFADQMGIVPGMRLLDVGSGIGGPSRYFAGHRGCRVTGIDLSPEFCETAKALSSRTGLADRTEYHPSSATSLPLADASFDGAYMLHVGMNISAKAAVFREVARVLKPGAVFGIFDMMREAAGDLIFPVPWSPAPEMSFVESSETYVELLRQAGFEIEKQRDRRDFARAFFAKMRETMAANAASGVSSSLALPMIMGPTAPIKIGNLTGMIERGLLSPIEIISRKR